MRIIPKVKKANEIKCALVTIQNGKVGILYSYCLAARPQSKNALSKFNEDVAKCCHEVCQEPNINACFLNACVDGASSKTKFVDSTIKLFFKGDITYTAYTDTNHNA